MGDRHTIRAIPTQGNMKSLNISATSGIGIFNPCVRALHCAVCGYIMIHKYNISNN
jgi:tRNA(Leu) C34 or U34 (ribose-2'-O)-methylase TrmL